MERIKDGRVYVESSGKYRTPREILTDGEPARLRVWANQAREARVLNEIKVALAAAVVAKDWALVDKCSALFESFRGSEATVGKLIADSLKAVEGFRPKPEAEATA